MKSNIGDFGQKYTVNCIAYLQSQFDNFQESSIYNTFALINKVRIKYLQMYSSCYYSVNNIKNGLLFFCVCLILCFLYNYVDFRQLLKSLLYNLLYQVSLKFIKKWKNKWAWNSLRNEKIVDPRGCFSKSYFYSNI